MKQFFGILAIGVVLIAGYVFYMHWSRTRALESGDVVEISQPAATPSPAAVPPATDAAKPEAQANSGKPAAAAVPAQPETLKVTPPAAPAQEAKPAALPTPAPSQPAKAEPTPSPSKPAPHQEVALNGPGPLQMHPQAKPTADVLPQAGKDGMIFTDKGRFQLYRQGDITWRMNTQTGKACVFLATEAQWSKTIVYQNGCGGR